MKKAYLWETPGNEYGESSLLIHADDVQEILPLESSETCRVYDRLDGSYIYAPEYGEIEIVYDENSKVNIDAWNGSDWSYKRGGKFDHASIYTLIEIDGEPAEDRYLLYTWSQWQGVLDRGAIIDAEERKELIEESEG